MIISKYFLEVKNRFFLLFITWFLSFLVCYFYKETLLFLVVQSQSFTNSVKDSAVFYFIFTGVTDIFSVYIKLVSFFSFQILLLYLLYHFFLFLSPALYRLEYYYLNFSLKIILCVWCISMVILTQILIPWTWSFFLSFQYFNAVRSINLYFEAKLNEYLSFYISLYYLCVFYCQIFTVLFFFLHYINVNLQIVKKFRKIYYYCFVIFATLISPPDILSQFLISAIIIITHEMLVFSFILKSSMNVLIRQPIKTN